MSLFPATLLVQLATSHPIQSILLRQRHEEANERNVIFFSCVSPHTGLQWYEEMAVIKY